MKNQVKSHLTVFHAVYKQDKIKKVLNDMSLKHIYLQKNFTLSFIEIQ